MSAHEEQVDRARRGGVRRVCDRELVAGDRSLSPHDGNVMGTPPRSGLRRARILVAGIGNVFLGDDGFGVEVVRRLGGESLGEGVDVADFGIRGVHLAFELADGGYDAAILVDAVPQGGAPGTLYAIEPEPGSSHDCTDAADAHGLTPDAVLAWVQQVGRPPGRIVIVGCEPATTEESMGLSPQVAGAVDGAIRMIRDLVAEMTGARPCA